MYMGKMESFYTSGKMESFYTSRTSSGKCQLRILILIHQKGEKKKMKKYKLEY